MRIIRESPFEGEKYSPAKEETEEECFPPSMFRLSPEPDPDPDKQEPEVILRLSETIVTEKPDTSMETVPVGIPEHDHEDGFREDSAEDIPSLHIDEISKGPGVFGDPPVEDLHSKGEETVAQQKPIAYGDLVIVDYAERKKSYKWPAIVNKTRPVVSNTRLCLQVI